MKLSTGKIAIPISYDNGDSEIIYITPNDRGLQTRLNDFQKNVEKKIAELDLKRYESVFNEDVGFDVENVDAILEASEEKLELLHKQIDAIDVIENSYNEAIKKELDEAFRTSISAAAFKYNEPFDVIAIENENGEELRELYIIYFLKKLLEVMKEHGEKNKQAMNKYFSKYEKK